MDVTDKCFLDPVGASVVHGQTGSDGTAAWCNDTCVTSGLFPFAGLNSAPNDPAAFHAQPTALSIQEGLFSSSCSCLETAGTIGLVANEQCDWPSCDADPAAAPNCVSDGLYRHRVQPSFGEAPLQSAC